MKSIYVIGSLRNPEIPKVANHLRAAGFEAFDDWFSAGKIADDSWRDYEKQRGNDYKAALNNHAARHVFAFDNFHLNRVHGGVLVMPAGKSGHLEAGILSGQGKPVCLLLSGGKAPARLDVMTQFLYAVCNTVEELEHKLTGFKWPKLPDLPRILMEDAYWLAGVLEGDGTFCLTGSVPRMVLQMTDRDVVERAAAIIGSAVWGSKRLTKGGKRVWACGIAGLPGVEWMRILRPLMGRRRQEQICKTADGWLSQRKYNKTDETLWRLWFRLSV